MPVASTVFILVIPVMFCLAIFLTCGEIFNRRIRCRGQEALLARSPRFVREARDRARRRAWPFNAPRPHTPTDEEAGLPGGYGSFDDFDGVHPAAYTNFGRYSDSIMPDYPSLTGSQLDALANGAGRPFSRDSAGYEFVRRFPASGEGQVELLKAPHTGELIIVKTIALKDHPADRQCDLPGEIKALGRLTKQHPNIIVWHGYTTVRDSNSREICNIRMEYCSGGDLIDYCESLVGIRNLPAPIFVLHFIASMSDALAYLHHGYGPSGDLSSPRPHGKHNAMIHRDIKPNNIFLRSKSNKYGMPDIVLGDFEFACLESESKGAVGTPGHYPPEAKCAVALRQTDPEAYNKLHGTQILTRSSDVYTFGAAVYSLAFVRTFNNSEEETGFNSHEPPDLAERFAATDLDQSPFVLDIMKRCFADQPADRIKTGELHDMAAQIKDLIADMYEIGARMTNQSVSRWEDQRQTLSLSSSVYTESAAPSADMAQISGFTDEFCWFPNHRSLSDRHPGPDCYLQRDLDSSSSTLPLATQSKGSITGRGVFGARATLLAPGNTTVLAKSYEAVLQSGFSDSSEDNA
ncbi:hypothetical protein LTR36_009459 [Oleoguttula mirabilis]|uniref:non-specific serine/threonine protein kinase n=1 Tax=Oleoguttula mirabilis TaxID=1507867 RepID=A0AAV9JSQ9_9PEZI|nr:hypothetical protein LTR36_009459 [Oleoguttula mirabilis]